MAVIPITPGGLGVVEFIAISTLTGFGVPGGVATAGVLCWRLVNFWLPIPFGGVSYVTLWRNRARLAASMHPSSSSSSSTGSPNGTASSNGTSSSIGTGDTTGNTGKAGSTGNSGNTGNTGKAGNTGAGMPDTDALPPGLVN